MVEEAQVVQEAAQPKQPLLSTDDLVLMIGEREVLLREANKKISMLSQQNLEPLPLMSRIKQLEAEVRAGKQKAAAVVEERDRLREGAADGEKLKAEVGEYQSQIKALFKQIEEFKRVNAELEQGAARSMKLEAENLELTKSVGSLRHYIATLEKQVHEVAQARDALKRAVKKPSEDQQAEG